MPIRRAIRIQSDPRTTYDAARELLLKHVEKGAFIVTEDEPPHVYGIGWQGPLASARYRFDIEADGAETRVQGALWLGGMLGPLHSLLRRRSNNKHVDLLLDHIKQRAEGHDDGDLFEDDSDSDEFSDEDLEDGFEDDFEDDNFADDADDALDEEPERPRRAAAER
ncbi:MAG: hypothetical protein V3V06_02215 [Dehalococcoidia bacterium]